LGADFDRGGIDGAFNRASQYNDIMDNGVETLLICSIG
jgi:hypothetical protein